jgi:hypothetical protein
VVIDEVVIVPYDPECPKLIDASALSCGLSCLWGEWFMLLLFYANQLYLLLAAAGYPVDLVSIILVPAFTAIELVLLPVS